MKSVLFSLVVLGFANAASAAVCPEGQEAYDPGLESGEILCRVPSEGVTCEIVGWEESYEEGGIVRRPVYGNCTPENGFGGNGQSDGPQAP